jgi:glycosyltransferase involved in cell wall biosynthesis
MKVIVNGKFLQAPMTGVHRVAYELCNALAALRQEQHSAVTGLEFELWHSAAGDQRAGLIDLPKRRVGPLGGIPWEQLTLGLRARDGILVNLCNIGPMLSRNAVTMIHDVQVHLSPASYRPAFRWWYHAVQPVLARRHRRLLTVSDFSREQIAAVGLAPAARVDVIPNGADHILRVPADGAIVTRLALHPRRYVVSLSTTQAHKNVARLLDAFDDGALNDIRLVLVGGADRPEFERAGMNIPDSVIFAGRVTDAELRGLLEQALCLAFPSTTEGFGLPPVEAFTVGCPVVAAPRGALPEVCGDAALYAPPDDSAAWRRMILLLAEDAEEWSRRARAGRERSEQFIWRNAALLLVEALRRAADRQKNVSIT